MKTKVEENQNLDALLKLFDKVHDKASEFGDNMHDVRRLLHDCIEDVVGQIQINTAKHRRYCKECRGEGTWFDGSHGCSRLCQTCDGKGTSSR